MTGYSPIPLDGLKGQRVLVRVDFNVPMDQGRITDDTRIKAALATIEALIGQGAKVILLAHFDRPKGKVVPEMSLKPVAEALKAYVSVPVHFSTDTIGADARAKVDALGDAEILVLENTRFNPGEEANDPEFVGSLAALGDAYVNDAFSAAHRAHASTEGVARRLPAYAGKAMERELDYLAQALDAPHRPVIAVVGGAKVSSKIAVLKHLAVKADILVVGGGMANTFLAARGLEVGASLKEDDFLTMAVQIEAICTANSCELILPVDVVVARAFEAHAPHRTVAFDAVEAGEMILDLGPESVDAIAEAMDRARTLVWNGPLGAFEMQPFDTATVEAARYAARLTGQGALVSVAGGGDTVAALNHAGVGGDFTFVSTAGGAFLEWMEGQELPGVAALAG
jgi:phosphoglycerate kinase